MGRRLLPILGAFFILAACADEVPLRARRFKAVPLSPLVQGDERAIEFADDSDIADDLAWRSTNEAVASVTPTGRVTAHAPGTAVLEGDGAPGAAQIQVKVAAAKLGWQQQLRLGRRSFLTVAEAGPLFVKSVASPDCDAACWGDVLVLDAKTGRQVQTLPGVGRIIAAEDRAFLERDGALDVYDYATGATTSLGYRGDLLGRFGDGSLLLGQARRAVRTDMLGNVQKEWPFEAPPLHAVIVGNDFYTVAGDKLFKTAGDAMAQVEAELTIPWAADYYGTLVLTDRVAYAFAALSPVAGYRLLPGVYSVIIGEDGLVQSEGLTAYLSVPLASLAAGTMYLELQTYGTQGQYHVFDVVYRDGADYHWRWGPSQCSDHPFGAAVVPGHAFLSSCDRVVRIDDTTLRPVGPWPQPGGNATRSWRAQ